MRAVIVSDYGAAPVVTELPTPMAGPGEVLIKLAAAGLNPMDVELASGKWRREPATFPMVLGVDGAGTVDSLGEGVTKFSLGERIFGQLLVSPIGSAGTYAEYVAVTAEARLAPVPEGLDLVEAAALPTIGGTGLTLAESVEPLEDKTVLLVGADGGVGSFACQYAVIAGARHCHCTCLNGGPAAPLRGCRGDRSHGCLGGRGGPPNPLRRHRRSHRPC